MMENDIEQLVTALTCSSPSTETLHSIARLLEKQTSDSLSSFVLESLPHLLVIEHWAWKELSNDCRHWGDNHYYVDFLHTLASFNRKLLRSVNVKASTKAYLLIPDTVDWIDAVFDRIETTAIEDHPLWTIASRWFDALSHLIYDHVQFVELPAIIQVNKRIECNFIMTDQFRLYLTQLHQPNVSQTIFSPKQLFYLKTCSLSIKIYVYSNVQYFPYTGGQILAHLSDDYFRLMVVQSHTVSSWSAELLACIAHLSSLVASCCWWDTNMTSHIKILLPFEQKAYEFVQALIRNIDHTPFNERITVEWSNEDTMLLDSNLLLLLTSLDIENSSCFIRSNTSLFDTLISVAETSPFDRICLCAYGILSRILSDEDLKEMKVANNMCQFFMNILEQAWNDPSQKYKQIPVSNLLNSKLESSFEYF
ncbi:unnamed protein product [Rotaria sp. Silwood2]|nr:unnamed protein product [Rotaria sp. Silwood2]CAF3967824.1 unnamed protein product [Rotaria sp. Silwood2]